MSLTESRTIGLDELRWQSLTRPEKLLVASLLERAADAAPRSAHIENVAYELREAAAPGRSIPIVLTSMQNRAIADVLQLRAEAAEKASESLRSAPAIARTANYAASYLLSLVDRLVRGKQVTEEAGRDRIVDLLLLEPPPPIARDMARELVSGVLERLRPLGLDAVFRPVLEAHAEAAVWELAERPTLSPDDELAFDFDIVDAGEEQKRLAERTFDAAIAAFGKDEREWHSFVAALGAGKVAGCEAAKEYPDVAESAVSTAFLIVNSVRRHLTEMEGAPWEAVRPGLRAILDGYPALKGNAALKGFVRAEVHRHFDVKPDGWQTP